MVDFTYTKSPTEAAKLPKIETDQEGNDLFRYLKEGESIADTLEQVAVEMDQDDGDIPSMIDPASDEYYEETTQEDIHPREPTKEPVSDTDQELIKSEVGTELFEFEDNEVSGIPFSETTQGAAEVATNLLIQGVTLLPIAAIAGPYAFNRALVEKAQEGKPITETYVKEFNEILEKYMFPFGRTSPEAQKVHHEYLEPLFSWMNDNIVQAPAGMVHQLIRDPRGFKKHYTRNMETLFRGRPELGQIVNYLLDNLGPETVIYDENNPREEYAALMATAVETAIKGLPLIAPLAVTKRIEKINLEKKEFANRKVVKDLEEGRILLARDSRKLEDALPQWISEVIDPETSRVKRVPLKKDLPPRFTADFVVDKILSGKWVAKIHGNEPLNWITSQVHTAHIRHNALLDRILVGERIQHVGRRAKRIASEGLIPLWEGMSVTEQAAIARVHRNVIDEGFDRRLTLQELKDYGLNEKQVKYWRKQEEAFYKTATLYNKAMAKYGGAEPALIDPAYNYFPAVWEPREPFRIFVRQRVKLPDDTFSTRIVETRSARTAKDALGIKEQMRAEYGEKYSVGIQQLNRTNTENPTNAFMDAIGWAERKGIYSTEAEAAAELMRARQASMGFRRHTKEKTGARGYMGDPKKGLSDAALSAEYSRATFLYIEGGLKTSTAAKLKAQMNEFQTTMQNQYPHTTRFAREYVNQYLGIPSLSERLATQVMEMGGKFLGGDKQTIKDIFGVGTSATLYLKLFGWKPTFLYATAIQPFQFITPKLAHLQTLGFKGGVFESTAAAIKNWVKPTAEYKDLAQTAVKRGVVEPEFMKQFFEEEYGARIGGKGKRLFEHATGKTFAGELEAQSRLMASYMFYSFLRKSGVKHNIARDTALDLAPTYMVEYHLAEKPMIYATDITRPIGQFKTFQSNYFGQFLEYYKTAKDKGSLKPLAFFLGNQALVSGLKGFMGVKAADSLIDQYNDVMQTTVPTVSELTMMYAPDLVAYGPINAVTEVANPTIDAPQLQVRDLIGIPQYDVAREMVSSTLQLLTNFKVAGVVNKEDLGRMLKAFSFSSTHGLIEELLLTNEKGLVVDPKHGYRGMYERKFNDKIIRSTGGRTIQEDRINHVQYLVTKAERHERDILQTMATLMAKAALNGVDINPKIIDEWAARYEIPADKITTAVLNSMKEQMTTAMQRALSISTKAGRNAAPIIMRLLEEGANEFDKQKEAEQQQQSYGFEYAQ